MQGKVKTIEGDKTKTDKKSQENLYKQNES